MLSLKNISRFCKFESFKSTNKLLSSQISVRKYWKHQKENPNEPFAPKIGRKPKECDSHEAVSSIGSFERCFLHGAAATPTPLLNALCKHAKEKNLKGLELVHIHINGDALHVTPEYHKHFRDNSLFIGANLRKAVNAGFADYTPIFLSEVPRLLEDEDFHLDVALVQVSPEDSHGYHSLGTSIDCSRSAILAASKVIGLVNEQMPQTYGEGFIHTSHFDYIVRSNFELPEMIHEKNELLNNIGKVIAEELIPDKACLQMGIGGIPDGVLAALGNHKDIGIHTEMFSDGILPLLDKGVITNAYKSEHPGKVLSSFVMGTKELYNYLHQNPLIYFADSSYTNDTSVISSNENVHAINSCIEMDLTGQICADSIGTMMYSGVGGQIDFMRGAVLSPNGKAIMAMNSCTNKGASKIKSVLTPGAGVVTTRSHVQYVVTEYGYARLYGKSLRERAKMLIELAHPDHREQLEREAVERFGQLELDWDAKLEYHDS